MTEFKHKGLFFDAVAVARVRNNAHRAPYKAALAHLADHQPTDPIAATILHGFRYQFTADTSSANQTASALIERNIGLQLPANITYAEACAVTIAIGHAFEMVRDHIPEDARRGWLRLYNERLEDIRTADNTFGLLDQIWRTATKIIGAIVVERGDLFVLGTDDFRRIVDNDIHPEGYFPAIVEKSEGGALLRQVMAAKGLVLAAEAANHQGVNLWDHEMRGISAKTAAIYAAAYYEYRDQWTWDTPPAADENEAFYQENAAFLEILNRQLRPAVLKATLSKLRPTFDPLGGGLTTLSHAEPTTRGLFGFSG